MRQTEHYGLNLWDLSDRIQMEDFNGDNQKLDAALAALAAGGGGIEQIGTTTGSLDPVYSTIKPIWPQGEAPRWNDYSLVFLMASVTETSGIPYFLLTTSFAHPFSGEATTKYSLSPGGGLYILTPLKDGSRNVSGLLIGGGTVHVFKEELTFDQIVGFKVGCETAAGADSSALIRNLQLFGVR